MAHFDDTWTKIEKLELTRPLAQLGSYLRSQPNTGVDKQNFSDSPSDLQLANLFNELKDANPDIRDTRTGQAYRKKDFEFWRDNRPLQPNPSMYLVAGPGQPKLVFHSDLYSGHGQQAPRGSVWVTR